mmetsp:Transcript_25537/g.52859  ORF Transcript_25537/g.52859 Transcript_25537/m.52859 type:complete len:256 (+) Transcript_25537:88-855(+)
MDNPAPPPRYLRPREHGAAVDKELAVLILHDPEVVVNILELHRADRGATLVPRQQLPNWTHRHLDAPDPLAEALQPWNRLARGVLDLHVDLPAFAKLGLGGRDHAATKGGQQLKPAKNRDDRQAENTRIEFRVEHAGVRVDHLRHAPDLGDAPAAGLELVQLEEEVALVLAKRGLGLRVLECLLHREEERARAEDAVGHGGVHQLPLAVNALEVGWQRSGHGHEFLHLLAGYLHPHAVVVAGGRVIRLAAIEARP